jgi:sugar lactone lactonase YvrE
VEDPRLVSVLGIAADARSKRLWVTSSDLGAGVKHAPEGPKHHAAVGVYDLTSGSVLHWVDLATLLPQAEHLVNGITLDQDGNAYITDSFAAAIYKVDPEGHASVLLQHDEFRGAGINLNGIVHHPDGFLLVIMKSSGRLYRVPLAEPSKFAAVDCPSNFVGGDGLWLASPDRLLVIANKTPTASANAAFLLQTDSAWKQAKVDSSLPLGDVYPTTCAVQNGKLYLLSSKLDAWLTGDATQRAELAVAGPRAEIRQIGSVLP